ncbi:uncharacterized protein LOC124811063 isoform X2 [Hydra vulgaris]|uniref:uncharacterized protein LOC124811063 isoform X2 n=1 Tax=Hydra vulgaris TaxID=6087 RepID=UPI0032EA5F25
MRKREKCHPENLAKFYIQRKIDQEGFLKVKINDTIGDVISLNEAKLRSQQYENEGLGCFIYNGIKDIYGKSVCIDATNQLSFMGCMVNDSPSIYANAKMKRIVESSHVSLCLFATKTIDVGTELRYDYGDERKKMFWRTMASCLQPLCYNQANCVEIGAINREKLDVLKVSLEKPLFDDSDSEIEYQYLSTVDNITESSFTKCDLIFENENELVCLSPNKETEFIAVLPSLITTPIIERCASWEELKTFSEASNSDVPKEDLNSTCDDFGKITKKCLNLIKTCGEIEVETSKPETNKYTKPPRLCLFCKVPQTRLKRHILLKHGTEISVLPLLNMNSVDQNRYIEIFRKEAIRNHNVSLVESGQTCFIRERKSKIQNDELPLMCCGCKGFYSRKYKARHQLVCQGTNTNLMIPMVSIASKDYENYSNDFVNLLNTLQLDDIGNYIKTDKIILMIGSRSYSALKRKKDKISETKRLVRSRMRLTARLYLSFKSIYSNQKAVKIDNILNNAADMYCREVITIVGEAINSLSEKSNEDSDHLLLSAQKSGLKISILNLLKLTAKFLIGYFLVKNDDLKSQRVVDLLKVLKLYEDDLFGDAYYNLNYRKNIDLRKPINLPNEADVQLLIEECNKIMNSIDDFQHPCESFVTIRSATATCLTIFNARRGGEPVRLHLFQWNEALNGEWMDKQDLPEEFDIEQMFITYQTGKGSDHTVPVLFPPECIKAMRYLTNKEVRKNAGIPDENQYIFASTQKSMSHASSWHCINEVLIRLDKKGAINATQNRHRIATILAKLELSEKEKTLIYNHFGHSERINQNVYQAAPGSLQIKTTGKRLRAIQEVTKVDLTPFKSIISNSAEQNLSTIGEQVIPTDVELITKNDSKLNSGLKIRPVLDLKKVIESETGRKKYPKRSFHEVDFTKISGNDSKVEGEIKIKQVLKLEKEKAINKKKNLTVEKKSWNKSSKVAFNKEFALHLKNNRGYPGRKEMEVFAEKFCLDLKQIRTRIVNTRRIKKIFRKKTVALMGID